MAALFKLTLVFFLLAICASVTAIEVDSKEIEDMESEVHDIGHRLHHLDHKLKVLTRAKRLSCGSKIGFRAIALCGGFEMAEETDIATYCCAHKCDDAYVRSKICPSKAK